MQNCHSNNFNQNGPNNFDCRGSLNTTGSLSNFDHENLRNTNVKHSNAEIGFQPEYPEFKDLGVIHENVNLQELIFHIKNNFESSDWLIRFQAINECRSLYKSMPTKINDILACFSCYLKRNLIECKTATNKMTLIAISDFFEFANTYPIDLAFATEFLDLLIKKELNPHKLIRSSLQKCLENLIKNSGCESLIQQLCELSINRNKKIGYYGFNYLAMALNNNKDSLHLLNERTTMMVFKTAYYVLDGGQGGDLKQLSKIVLDFYVNIMGNENFDAWVGKMTQENYFEFFEGKKIIELKNGKIDEKPERYSVAMNRMRQERMSSGGIGIAMN